MKFRLVDKIVDYSKGISITTRKAISFEEYSLLKPWGRKGAFPETLILQIAVESASLLLAVTSEFREICLLKEVVSASFQKQTKPGDILSGTVDIHKTDETHWYCKFKISAGQNEISKGIFVAETIPLHSCFYTEDYILLWKELIVSRKGAKTQRR